MDKPESRQEERLSIESSESDTGSNRTRDENNGGSAEANSGQKSPVTWVKDQEISFKKVLPLFKNLKETLETAISEDKKRLSSLMASKNSIGK